MDIDPDIQLRDSVSLYIESILSQPALKNGCDLGTFPGAAGDTSVN